MNKRKIVSFVQNQLNDRYITKLTVDGNAGEATMTALRKVSAIPGDYSKGRQIIAFIQYLTHLEASIESIVIDGYVGPDTDNAIEQLLSIEATGEPNYWRGTSKDRFGHFDLSLIHI